MDTYNKINMEYAIEDFLEAYNMLPQNLFKEYLALSTFVQSAFLPTDSSILNTGNFTAINKNILAKIYRKIKKHPFIWKTFFMIKD